MNRQLKFLVTTNSIFFSISRYYLCTYLLKKLKIQISFMNIIVHYIFVLRPLLYSSIKQSVFPVSKLCTSTRSDNKGYCRIHFKFQQKRNLI
jgi:hypothetical protein